jgi:hypothetical protein
VAPERVAHCDSDAAAAQDERAEQLFDREAGNVRDCHQ